MALLALTGMDRLTIAGFVATILGLVATIVGFTIAWIQLRRTKKAAEAALDAGEAVRAQLQNVQLAWLLPRFQETEAELEAAQDPVAAQRALAQWRGFAPQAEAIVRRDAQAPSGLAKELRATAVLASLAQQSLREGTEMGVALHVVLPSIGDCNYNMALYVADTSLSSGPGQYQ